MRKRLSVAQRLFQMRGEVDFTTAPGLHASLHEAVADGDADLLIDFHDVSFIDETGISVLTAAQRRLQAEGRSLRVVNANPITARAIDIRGLVEFLRVNEQTDARSEFGLRRPGGT
jgi:anti-sigma B factor antagonist